MSDVVISVENLSKQYRLGTISRRTLRADLASWWARRRGLPDPNLRIGQEERAQRAGETIWALRDINLEVRRGEILGIIGRNGAGKSTLLKILSRITAPTSGQIKVKGRIGSLLEVGTGFHPELTGRENVYLNGAILGMTKAEVASKFDEIVDFAGIEQFIDTPVKRYSSGMYVRLAFAVAAHLDPEILVVDEVLAVGDAEFQKKCLGKMGEVAQGGRTVLFVSHNMAAVERLCHKAVVIKNGEIVFRGLTRNATEYYIGYKNLVNEAAFDGPVQSVHVGQTANGLEILLEYAVEAPLRMPGLGFVISDVFGTPICGASPMADGVEPLKEPRKSGTVRVEMLQPKLRSGAYILSIWFGDGTRDFFIAKDLLRFEIANAETIRQQQATVAGPVVPQCAWTFSS